MAGSDAVSSALAELGIAQRALGDEIAGDAGSGNVPDVARANRLATIGQHVAAAIVALSAAAAGDASSSSSSSSSATDGAAAAAADVGANAGGAPQPTRDPAELRSGESGAASSSSPAPANAGGDSSSSSQGSPPASNSAASSAVDGGELGEIRRRLNVIESRLEAIESGQTRTPAPASPLEGAAAASSDVGRGQGRAALSLERNESLEGAAAAAADVGKGR